MKLNLRGKLLLPSFFVILLGMSLAGFFSFNASKNALESTIKEQVNQVSVSLSRQMDGFLEDLAASMVILSKRNVTQAVFSADASKVDTVAVADKVLKNMQADTGKFEFLAVAGPEGRTLAASDESITGTLNVADRAYFREALTGKTAFSDVIKSKVTGNPTFIVAVPVQFGGRTAGVCFGSVDLVQFNRQFISPIKIGNKGYAYLVDQAGTFLAHPDTGKILSDTIGQTAWGKQMLQQKAGFQKYLWNDQEKMVAYQSVRKTGWIVAAGAEMADIFAPVAHIRNLTIVATLLTLLAVATVIFLIAASVVKAVKQGVDFAEDVTAGDVSRRLELQRSDEIGVLGEALDRMADGLEQKAKLAEEIAAGNLAVNVPLASERDQLGKALTQMTDSLNELMGQIQLAGEQIAAGSGQVADSSQSLSQGATESASSLEEISASMTELGSQTRLNADNAGKANQLVGHARDAADKGNRQMTDMVKAMDDINTSGQNISKIIKVIDEIAFQTNLQALNAAVEAARAGHHGKGFAVVAEEVRNLAARSAKAAKETAELIEGATAKSGKGTEIADQTASSLRKIVASIGKITDLAAEIAVASKEQAMGLDQIHQGLGQIDQVTQHNTANAEESAAASETLSQQAERLRQLLATFKIRQNVGQGSRYELEGNVRSHASQDQNALPY
jgi:methyl-accepting chemotaxis protein